MQNQVDLGPQRDLVGGDWQHAETISTHRPPRMRVQIPRLTPPTMDIQATVLRTLDDVLALEGRAQHWTRETPLLGAVPELDSMAVVSLLTELAERFAITIDDDDFDGAVFATVGSLSDFVRRRAAG
jgi:acyl carrier protein